LVGEVAVEVLFDDNGVENWQKLRTKVVFMFFSQILTAIETT